MWDKSIKKLDNLLSFTFGAKNRSFILQEPLQTRKFQNVNSKLINFGKLCDYFSSSAPLIAKVSSSLEDINFSCHFLEIIHQEIASFSQRSFITGEFLAKVLAYRDLKVKMEVPIPSFDESLKPILVNFTVDQVFDLWHGMPAFGLLPDKKEIAPILLFRGTDFTLSKLRGWASILSDLDVSGPGLRVFLHSQRAIHIWLDKVMGQSYLPARLIGFSLGGAFVHYTAIYEASLVNKNEKEPSMVFNPPGLDKKVEKDWKKLDQDERKNLLSFVTRGDLVPKIGKLIAEVSECSLDETFEPIASHVIPMSLQRTCYLNSVDVEKENLLR